ncbi:MAG TPA: trypsin-like peptidase domain-containing protein [Isosphaeraceae bacterium]|jgi:S1-C subfamily serine protease|nr:trypsin-like peptidase domain-containing protein [Isosphaeraceae bacterium]
MNLVLMLGPPEIRRYNASLFAALVVILVMKVCSEVTMMRNVSSLLAAALLVGVAPSAMAADAGESAIQSSVVKVFATLRYPDMFRPWTKQDPREASGTGVVIEGQRILTNAHVARYASQILIQPNQSSEKLSAAVEVLSNDVDLAILKLDDPSFFDKHPALARAPELPEIKDAVHMYGYPVGGESLSITKGIVSRIEFGSSYFKAPGTLWVQVDAAINPGNSGGPALVSNRMVGIASSRLLQSDNIGYIIPSEEIDLFLQDVADGHYDGKPALFDGFQTLDNAALRAKLKVDKSTSGVVLAAPHRPGEAYPLKPWDIVTQIGDQAIDNSGMVRVNGRLRLRFQYLVQKQAIDGKVRLSLIRDGQPMTVEVPVSPDPNAELFRWLGDKYPSYFIWGPLVFSPVTEDFLRQLDNRETAATWYPPLALRESPLITRRRDWPRFEGEELIIVTSAMFPHKVSKGYDNPYTQVVESINGVKVRNLHHLVETLRDSSDEFITIKCADKDVELLVFNRKETLAATEEILTENGVRRQCSEDVRAVWEGKGEAR